MALYLSTNARILGSKKQEDYQRGNGVPSGNGNMVLIYAVNARNMTIEGRGTINGQGAAFYTGTGEGTENSNIKTDGGDLSKVATLLKFSRGATEKVVKLQE